MQLIIHEGIATLAHDCITATRSTRVVGQFGDSDEDSEAALGFAQGHAERLIGTYRTAADAPMFFGVANNEGQALAVWIEVAG